MSRAPFTHDTPVTLAQTIWPVVENGYSPVPVKAGEKRPILYKWQQACTEIASHNDIERWHHQYGGQGLGIATNGLFIADNDELDPAKADEIEALVKSELGDTPLKRSGFWPKRQLWYRCDTPIKSRSLPGFDALGAGRFSVAFNTHPRTGQPYHWFDRSPLNTPRSDLPSVTPAQVDKLLAKLGRMLRPNGLASHPDLALAIRGNELGHTLGDALGPQELVRDLRDHLLFSIVDEHFRRGERDPDRLAAQAFAEFSRRAELKRPRTRDGEPWAFKHALEKASWVVGRGEERLIPTQASIGEALEWSPARKQLFAAVINAACATGALPRSAVKVSDCMLGYVGRAGGCYVTTRRLAAECNLDQRTVKAAREQLVKAGFWTAGPCPGREHLALYVPNVACLSKHHRG
jgi:hypothetical protein